MPPVTAKLQLVITSGGSRGPGAMPSPLAAWKIFFRQYINIITKPTAYDGPWEY